MLHEKFTLLLDEMNLTVTQFSKISGIDRTTVSKYKSGKRIPKSDSKSAKQLVAGIQKALWQCERMEPVKERIRGSVAGETSMEGMLGQFLFEHVQPAEVQKKEQKKKRRQIRFGEKLDILMKICGYSGVQLANLLSVDPSLIYRYRNGSRFPSQGSEIKEQLCSILYTRICRMQKEEETAVLIQIPKEQLSEGAIQDWLMEEDLTSEKNTEMIEQLLEQINTGRNNMRIPEDLFRDWQLEKFYHSKKNIYYGDTGFQEGIFRLLEEIIREEKKELWIYSDRSIGQYYENDLSKMVWAYISQICIRKQIRVRNVFSFGSQMKSLTKRLSEWIPFYLSGQMESFYFYKAEENRFPHTIFLCPGLACVDAIHMGARKKQSIYHYYTSEQMLSIYQESLEELFESAKPLARTVPTDFPTPCTGPLQVVQNGIGIATMPEWMAKSFGEEIYRVWKIENRAFLEGCEKHSVVEISTMVRREDFAEGKVRVDVIDDQAELEPVYYTEEQYRAHIRYIRQLIRENPSYTCIMLADGELDQVRFVAGTDIVKITRKTDPKLSIIITHPMIQNAFRLYIRRLKEIPALPDEELEKWEE